MDWYSDELEKPTEITVKELELLCEEIKKQRDVCDEHSKKLKEENSKLDKLESSLIGILESMGKDSYKSDVGTFGVTHRTSVRLPQGDDKFAFFEYLKERNLFDGLITVNSQTLNSFYKTEFEKAAEEGRLDSFSIPGIGEPSISKTVSFRKAK